MTPVTVGKFKTRTNSPRVKLTLDPKHETYLTQHCLRRLRIYSNCYPRSQGYIASSSSEFLILSFWSGYFQLDEWLEELRNESSEAIGPDSVEAAERQLETYKQQRLTSLDACLNTIAQGEALLQELR